MRTANDEKRDEAARHVQAAIECLGKVVTDGHDDYTKDYCSCLRKAFGKLLRVRRLLKGDSA